MDDLISRQAAIDKITEYGSGNVTYMSVVELKRRIEHLPSTQPETHEERAETHACDCISRQAAIDALDEIESEVADGYGYQYEKWRKYFCELPSAQPTEASCWGCNCQKMEKLKERKTFSEMVHLHDAERREE